MNGLRVVLVAGALAFSAQALAQESGAGIGASNFSYSTLGIQLGKLTPDQEINFLGERYEDFGLASVNGGIQLADNLAISGAIGAATNDGPRTEITTSSVLLGILVPIPLGDRADIVPRVGYLNTEVELCADDVCVSEDDSVVAYGVGVRFWAVPGQIELGVGFGDNSGDDSEATLGLQFAAWAAEHHRFSVGLETSDSADAVLIGYNYVW